MDGLSLGRGGLDRQVLLIADQTLKLPVPLVTCSTCVGFHRRVTPPGRTLGRAGGIPWPCASGRP